MHDEDETGEEERDCSRCYGSGEVRKWHNEGEDWIECPECRGTGREPYTEDER